MPNNAPIPKKNAVMRTYGANVYECEPTNEARAALAERKRKETGAQFIHPSNDPRVIAGQGTIALEIVEQIKEMTSEEEGRERPLDALVVPCGGGGMLSGIATVMKTLSPSTRVYGVEPTNASDAKRAKEAGDEAWDGQSKHLPGVPVRTCADGLKTCLLENNWPIVRDKVDGIFDVSESDILRAMELVVSRMKLAIEPSAATGLALVLSSSFRRLGHERVGIVLCGGNADYGAVFEQLRAKYC